MARVGSDQLWGGFRPAVVWALISCGMARVVSDQLWGGLGGLRSVVGWPGWASISFGVVGVGSNQLWVPISCAVAGVGSDQLWGGRGGFRTAGK